MPAAVPTNGATPDQEPAWRLGSQQAGQHVVAGARVALDSFLDHYRAERSLGLDLMRIAASLTIVAYHSSSLASILHQGPLKDGYLAVDVFFILSGWLLTGQALAMRKRLKTRREFAVSFWFRRWLRILPAYWFLLLVLFISGGALWEPFGLKELLVRAVFLQSFLEPYPYGPTWSLITEEWFYLVLPIIVLLAPLIPRRIGWTVVICLGLLLPTAIRGQLVATTDATRFADFVIPLTRTYDRYEGLVLGAVLAVGVAGRMEWYRWLDRHRTPLFWASVLTIAVILALNTRDAAWFRVPGILLFDILVAAAVPFMSSLRWPTITPELARMGVTFLAELTYPIYLLHLFVLRATDHLKPEGVTFIIVTSCLLVATATIIHIGVERPFLALRSAALRRRKVAVVAT